MEEIEIIQGDSLATIVKIENPDEMNISRVIFACPSLEIEKDLIPANTEDDSEWALIMSPEDTITLWVGRWDFNLTAITDGGQQYTIIPHGNFLVYHKRNKGIPEGTPTNVIHGIGYTED